MPLLGAIPEQVMIMSPTLAVASFTITCGATLLSTQEYAPATAWVAVIMIPPIVPIATRWVEVTFGVIVTVTVPVPVPPTGETLIPFWGLPEAVHVHPG